MKRQRHNGMRSVLPFLCGLAVVCFFGVLTADGATQWKFSRTYIYKDWNDMQIEREDVRMDGGSLDLVISGKVLGLCPNGSERVNIKWRFDKDISRFNPGDTFGAKLETHMTSASGDCTGGLSWRTHAFVSAGVTAINWDKIVGKRGDGDRFMNKSYERASPHKEGPNAGSTVMMVNTIEPFPDRTYGGFIIYVSGPGGDLAYLYAYEPASTGGNTGSTFPEIGGTWFREGDTKRPASIRQTGNSLVFTNENGNSSQGHFESGDVVVADSWQGGLRGRLSPDRTRIDWANGSSWSRGSTPATFANLHGTWYREGNRSLQAFVDQNGGALVFTNERGEKSAGHFESYYVVVADSWQGGLRGRVDQKLTRINWDNGSSWQR